MLRYLCFTTTDTSALAPFFPPRPQSGALKFLPSMGGQQSNGEAKGHDRYHFLGTTALLR